MPVDPKLEAYLAALDRALGPVPTSDRADIVMEIKSHVLSSLEAHPEQNVAAVLRALGEPESVANRYLVERGLKPGKASKSPMLKWLTIGFLGTLAILALLIVFFVTRFTPLISVDEGKGHVQILGGMININGDDGGLSLGGAGREFSGSRRLDPAAVETLEVRFANGKLEVTGDVSDTLRWDCKGAPFTKTDDDKVDVKIDGKTALLDLGANNIVRCDLGVPLGIALKLDGGNGKVALVRPQAPVAIEMANGEVAIEPDPAKTYRYDLHVTNGKTGDFPSSDDPSALPVSVRLGNGNITNDRED
jgi:hypothetical protein